MDDEQLWKKRFHQLMLVRLAGLAMLVLGFLIMVTDLVREGGWPEVGAILVVMGAIDTVFAPKMLKKIWNRQ